MTTLGPGPLVATEHGLHVLDDADGAVLVAAGSLRAAPGELPRAPAPTATAGVAPSVRVGLLGPTSLWADADGRVWAWSVSEGRRVVLSSPEVELLASASGIETVGDLRARGPAMVAAGERLLATGVWALTVQPPVVAERPLLQARARPAPAATATRPPGGRARGGRVQVHPVCASPISGLPLGLGDVVAAAIAFEGGRLQERYDILPIRVEIDDVLADLEGHDEPVILLLSNFLWSIDENLRLVREVKRRLPGSLAVHGGPSTPKYDDDVADFFAADHAPDVAVLGEGEATLPDLLARLDGSVDLRRVGDLPGAIVRHGATPRRGPERERIADLGVLPSPYLSGLFDHLDGGALGLMAVETNRGCPYGCTFCDWGSATLSRIRQQPLDRVLAELSWIAERDVGTLFIADANFGILPRDVDIAAHIAELRSTVGAPRAVLSSFAKNTVKHSAEIVEMWVRAGISTEGSVALQTSDPETLSNIRRRNIKIEKYDALADEFRRLGLPVATDLMLGLPGATVASFKTDLQRCIDQDITARIYPTVVLPNAPMNDPAYRAEFELVLDEDQIVVGSSSYSVDEYREMLRVRRAFRAGEHFGVVRHVIRYVEHQTGMRAIDQLDAMSLAGAADPIRWPGLRWFTHHMARWTIPPAGWEPLLDEVGRFVVDELGAPDEPGLRTVLRVEAALLPWPGRSFPDTVELDHDYVTWYHQVLRPVDPLVPRRVRPLAQMGPGTIEVTDPSGVCGDGRAAHLREHPHPSVDSVIWNDFWIVGDWELGSPLARPLISSGSSSAA